MGAVLVLASPFLRAHDGHSSRLPWAACDDRVLGEYCEFENANHDRYRGTCQAVSSDLMCVRNQPLMRHCALDGDCGVEEFPTARTSPPTGTVGEADEAGDEQAP